MHNHRHPHYHWLRKRGMRLRIATIIAIGLVLLAFQWTVPLPDAPPAKEPESVIMIIDTVIRTKHSDPREIPAENIAKPLSDVIIKPVVEGPVLEANLNLNVDDVTFDIATSTSNPEPEPDVTPPIYWVSEVMPEFPGGMEALSKFLRDELKYPVNDFRVGREGKVYLTFVIDEIGRTTQIVVNRSPSPYMAAEAIRVVESMPLWEPGRQGGRKVKVYYQVEISFKLY